MFVGRSCQPDHYSVTVKAAMLDTVPPAVLIAIFPVIAPGEFLFDHGAIDRSEIVVEDGNRLLDPCELFEA